MDNFGNIFRILKKSDPGTGTPTDETEKPNGICKPRDPHADAATVEKCENAVSFQQNEDGVDDPMKMCQKEKMVSTTDFAIKRFQKGV